MRGDNCPLDAYPSLQRAEAAGIPRHSARGAAGR
jgi:hypothetical protein